MFRCTTSPGESVIPEILRYALGCVVVSTVLVQVPVWRKLFHTTYIYAECFGTEVGGDLFTCDFSLSLSLFFFFLSAVVAGVPCCGVEAGLEIVSHGEGFVG